MVNFYNTINKKKEEFIPINKDKITLYTCGPTVYNYAHIGNFRAYIFEDLLRRTLEYAGYNVFQVMNITDIDDKTIKRSISDGVSLEELTNKYTDAFFEDLDELNIVRAHEYPRATKFIKQIIGMIQKLVDKGFAYQTDDSSVFFRVSKFSEYGKLANLNPDNMKIGDRVDNDEYEKEEIRDFALWKGYKEEDGDVLWDSPWGKGRPGWHIECSVMSTFYLGSSFDIHCGGVDNIFPHHENEIAQSKCALDDKFVNYWLHNEHLLVENQKMSKSSGNFYTIRDILDKGYKSEAIRYVLISSHYRQKLNFTMNRLDDAQKAINKLRELIRRLNEIKNNISSDLNVDKLNEEFLNDFKQNLYDDLNISGALGALFTWVNKIFNLLDQNKINKITAKKNIEILLKIDKILGIIEVKNDITDEDKKLISLREEARKNKNWVESDRIRDELNSRGILIEDTQTGTIWKFK